MKLSQNLEPHFNSPSSLLLLHIVWMKNRVSIDQNFLKTDSDLSNYERQKSNKTIGYRCNHAHTVTLSASSFSDIQLRPGTKNPADHRGESSRLLLQKVVTLNKGSSSNHIFVYGFFVVAIYLQSWSTWMLC